MIIKIVYVSRSLSPLPLEIKDILVVSRKNNKVLEVSGALCFLNGVYIQYLEGDAATVNALYLRIEDDPRHRDVKKIVHEQIAQREYPDWSMALLTWNEETKAIFESFYPDSEFDAYAADPQSVMSLIQAWSRTPNWMTV